MSDKNNLIEYKDEHYGKMFIKKPMNFADVFSGTKSEWTDIRRIYSFPYDLYLFISGGSWQDNLYDDRKVANFYNALDTKSFFDNDLGKKGTLIKFPKKIPLMLLEEFSITHKITKTNVEVYKILCIFPDYIKVPAQVRKIQYYGQKNWFQPYAKSSADAEKFLREIKIKYSKKY